jgi:hypothetical protein
MAKLRHICEVCETEAILEPEEAYNAGWDYPPRMGVFGTISPRTCPNCAMASTVWWKLAMEKADPATLTSKQRLVCERISQEPESILVKE